VNIDNIMVRARAAAAAYFIKIFGQNGHSAAQNHPKMRNEIEKDQLRLERVKCSTNK
jgi:hypothetical protein